jgi:3-oxoadipate enol-lactonase
MSAEASAKAEFEVDRGGWKLRGEQVGEGPAIVMAHGVSATRRYVVQGSVALARHGYAQVSYDARGHGESDPPLPGGGHGYDYDRLAADLGVVIDERGGGGPVVLVGHSMGAHTVVNRVLSDPEPVAGLVLVGPVQTGDPAPPETLAYWDRLGEALERGGVDGFMAAYDDGLNPEWRETILRFTRQRMEAHRHPGAVADALRAVARSQPFDSFDELRGIGIPTLVVASRDESDPGHPYAVAERYAEAIPGAKLVSEGEGESPLAWQGGKLSREIAEFCGAIGF